MSHLTRLIRFARHWHARIGVLTAVFFLLLAVSGLALNHTESLQLAKRQVSARWLMQWYGLKAEYPAQGYLFERGYFIGDRQHWMMDGRVLPASDEPVIGAVEVGGMRYVATGSAIHIYQPGGGLVEKLTGSALPAPGIVGLGVADGMLLVQTPKGMFVTEDALEWQAIPARSAAWSKPQLLPDPIRAQVAEALAPSLPLERVVLDVHSGRVFGRYGPWMMDLAAVVLIALSLSGTWIYLRSIRRRHA